MKKKMTRMVLTGTILLIFLAGCSLESPAKTTNSRIEGSGTIAVHDIRIAPEIGGKVIEVFIKEGNQVKTGEPLFRLDDEILQAQTQQAAKTIDAAKAAVAAAQAQLKTAKIQYELALQAARIQNSRQQGSAWAAKPPQEIELPVWYYEKDEKINALKEETANAENDLDIQLANLTKETHDIHNQKFLEVEENLGKAQAAFEVASLTLQQAKQAADKGHLEAIAQQAFDTAKAELKAVQLEYDRLLNTSEAQNILESRAHVAIARKRLNNARSQLDAIQTGKYSLQVKAAKAALEQAQSAVEQAKANQTRAESAIRPLEIRLQKAIVKSPVDGIVFSSSITAGELAMPGEVVMTIGKLENLELTVYISETDYGKISLGQNVSITTDSYPGKTFPGTVQTISDKAEFTPRNVQTVDGRKSTVYAVKITVPNLGKELKPGIPVDVLFEN